MDTQNTTEMQNIVASSLELENNGDGGNCAFYPEGTKTDKLFRYSGENYLPGIPTRNDIVAGNNKGSTVIMVKKRLRRLPVLKFSSTSVFLTIKTQRYSRPK